MMLLAILPFLLAGSRSPFSSHQLEMTTTATRAGLAKWAATPHGHAILDFLVTNHCDVTVFEDPDEEGIGRAPEPGIATLLAAYRSEPRGYIVILNPALAGRQPARARDAMAIAWAGEMLHVYYYAQGISLPHHSRLDFQQDWQKIAAELGVPTLAHDDAGESQNSAIVLVVGDER